MALEKGDTLKLTLEPDELRLEDNKIAFKPGRRRKSASYSTYYFDPAQFKTKIGELAKMARAVQVTVKVTDVSHKSHTPSKGASPIGGFRFTYYTVDIVEVIGPVGGD